MPILLAEFEIPITLEAQPLRSGMQVLEIGCGSGAAAREIVRRWPDIFVQGIDRFASAIRQATVGAEHFELLPEESKFDLAFALRVCAFDGRHPRAGELALPRIRAAMMRGGRLFIDGGAPLRELPFCAA